MGPEHLVVALYLAILWVPGLIVAGLAGVRGWTLAALAPLLTYAIVGMFGPIFAGVGIDWTPQSTALMFVVICAGTVAGRVLLWGRNARPGEGSPPPWSLLAHTGVAVLVTGVALLGATVIWTGLGHLGAIPQDWDAVFHANGIRWIADTGDSSLTGMGSVNWFEDGVAVYYPNAYHLIGALVYLLSGADIPTVLNAHTVLLPGLGALVIVALVRRFGGRPLLAAGAAGASVAFTAFYDMLWRGPLLPFVTGMALMPMIAILLADLLDDRADRIRLIVRGVLFGLGLSGIVALNPANLFSAAVFVLPMVVQRWAARPQLLRIEPLVVLGAGAVAALLSLPDVLGSLGSASGEPVFDWPAGLTESQAVGELVTLAHDGLRPQWWLMLLVGAGLYRIVALDGLRWTAASGLAFAAMFVLAASSDEDWVNALTRPWWNDQWRLVGLCVAPASILVGHALSEVQKHGAVWVSGLADRIGAGPPQVARLAVTLVTSGIVLAVFYTATQQLYLERNVTRMRLAAPDGPAVSAQEVEAMRVLGRLVPPGERVLNDRGDGSAWMYAIAGVLPVAGHYNASHTGWRTTLLNNQFNTFEDEQPVRYAVHDLDISYVMVNRGFVRPDWRRAPGLTGLDDVDWLQRVYRNQDSVIYKIREDLPAPGPYQNLAPNDTKPRG